MCGWIRERQRQRVSNELVRSHRPKSGALGRQLLVHTQPFAFRALEEDDESVKMSKTTSRRARAFPLALTGTRTGVDRFEKRQFLFTTNERLFPTTNFATRRKQSTSFFLFSTNERSRVTHHQSLITNIVARTGEIACATEG